MKKNIIQMLLLLLLVSACRKDNDRQLPQAAAAPGLTLAQVKNWYAAQVGVGEQTAANQPPNSAFSSGGNRSIFAGVAIDWQKAAQVNTLRSNWWVVPIDGQSKYRNVQQGYRKIAFIRDSTGSVSARLLEIIPDALYIQRRRSADTKTFTGRVFIYDPHYHLIKGYVFGNGKIGGAIRTVKSGEPALMASPFVQNHAATATTGNNSAANKFVSDETEVVVNCTWYQDNYINADGEVVVYAEQDCSSTTYVSGGDGMDMGGGSTGGTGGNYLGSGGGGGAPTSTGPAVSNLPGETGPAADPKALMKCFSEVPDAGATMKITVYVQEPWPGTSFDIGPNSVGHTAIGLTKTNGSNSVTQVLGFYPNATGLSKINAPSKIVVNNNLDYTVSITYNVTLANFNKIANYVANPPSTYDLTDFNCTNFVYSACQSGGITLPNATGFIGLNSVTVLPEYGMTPAALGNSIDKMKGKSNVNTNGGITPISHGQCN